MSVSVRDASADDIAAIHAIYAHHVNHGFGTFDETPPTLDAYEAKWREGVAMELPWLVGVEGRDVVGFAYAAPFRPRTGYRYTLEDSVYVRDDRRGRGIGSALLLPLVERCIARGARQLVAVIGDSGNVGSIALHRKAGFEHAGTVKAVGFKLGRWVDIVFMQRALNGGDGSLPPAQGAWRFP
jgi:L-amino acid N-acyltransferase YncA